MRVYGPVFGEWLPLDLAAMFTKQGLKRLRHATRPGYGMGKGRNTLIHKGRKP